MCSPDVKITWRDLAQVLPEFVAWAVQRHGGLPDGPVSPADYRRLSDQYQQELDDPQEHEPSGDGVDDAG